MDTINIQIQVPHTGQYTLDEFVAKVKDHANNLVNTISKPVTTYQEASMSQEEQEAYVAESLNRALDQMEAHRKNGTKPMSFDEFMAKLEEEQPGREDCVLNRSSYGRPNDCLRNITL